MIRFILFLIILSDVTYAKSDKIKLTFSPTSEGGYIYEYDSFKIPTLPKWNLALDDPPLSIHSALSIARGELDKSAQKQPLKLASIRLSYSASRGHDIVWYYSVLFVNDAKYRRDGFLQKKIIILMDGKVIVPRKISKDEYAKYLGIGFGVR